jgi:hypothetical protein
MTTETTIFEKASRQKTRFSSSRGNLNTEDLWDLPVGELDGIFKSMNAELRTKSEESLLGDQNDMVASELEMRVAIIRHIVHVKLVDAAAAEQEVARGQKKARIMAILADKQDEGLVAMSEEELSEMLEDL